MPDSDRRARNATSGTGVERRHKAQAAEGTGGADDESTASASPPPPPVAPEDGAPHGPRPPDPPHGGRGNGEHNFDADLVRWTRVVAILTGGLILAGLLQFGAAIFQWSAMNGQLKEMRASSGDTQRLARAGEHQAIATGNLLGASQDQARAARSEATAMDKLRQAGEAQAKSMEDLRGAGEAQARSSAALADAGRSQAASTQILATATSRQLGAIQAQADAARTQSVAVGKSADAAIIASKATDRLANAGQAQAKAVLQSLDLAKQANDIAEKAGLAADRPWVDIEMPGALTALQPPKSGADFMADIFVANRGRSPALHVRVIAEIQILARSEAVFWRKAIKAPCRRNAPSQRAEW